MFVRGKQRKIKTLLSLGGVFILVFLFFYFHDDKSVWSAETRNTVNIIDNGLEVYLEEISSMTIGELLEKQKLTLKDGDTIFPDQSGMLIPNMRIYITRAQEISVTADGETKKFRTQAKNIEDAVRDGKILLDEDDIVKPSRESFVLSDMHITITRVKIEEKIVDKDIPFTKKANEDKDLSWRKTIVTQKGEKGIERQTYRVSSHDGKEVNRKLLKTEVIKEPVAEVVTQGTYVKLGKSHTGAASWYAWTGTMAAANPWLPKGSYVKVTNVDNGKSVIVVINDRGPFVPGRIIDLDKVAFQKIASIGAGVINVKMEEITN